MGGAVDVANSEKPKLLVILGAGSSIPCGMPSVACIDEKMKEWSLEGGSNGATQGEPVPERDAFNWLWKAAERHYGCNHYGLAPNYEGVLGQMIALAHWVSPPPFGDPLREAVASGIPFGIRERFWEDQSTDSTHPRLEILRQYSDLGAVDK